MGMGTLVDKTREVFQQMPSHGFQTSLSTTSSCRILPRTAMATLALLRASVQNGLRLARTTIENPPSNT